MDQLRATFAAAAEFGLSDEEIWRVAIKVCDQVAPNAPVEDCLDNLTAAGSRERDSPKLEGDRRPVRTVIQCFTFDIGLMVTPGGMAL